jgi:hypothetical protein
MMVSCLSCSSTLEMEAIYSSETSVDFHRTVWNYILEDTTLHSHRCENLKSIFSSVFPATFLKQISPIKSHVHYLPVPS